MARLVGWRLGGRRTGQSPLPPGTGNRRSPAEGRSRPILGDHALHQHDPVERQEPHPGNRAIEHRIRSAIRWNALAIVLKANKESSELGGHIASFQSAATLYDTGFMHFWRAASDDHGGDLVYVQGHSSPGIYARAFLEGRLTEEQLLNFRQEVDGRGLSSYPHPWLMPDFWQFPTVSMGLGPSWRSTRRGSSSTCISGAWPRPRDARSGPSWATARWTSRRAWAPYRWPDARSSTTSSSSSTATCSGWTGRGNGKIVQELEANFRGPAGTSSRCCGARAGTSSSPRTRPECS